MQYRAAEIDRQAIGQATVGTQQRFAKGGILMTDRLQTLENAALRTFLKLPKDAQGIVVDEPERRPGDGGLRKWDVITKIGANAVDDQGMIKLGANSRVGFQYLVQSVAKDGKVPLTVIRDSKPLQIDLPVRAARPGR